MMTKLRCSSGGKDSTLMAKLFQELRKHGNKKLIWSLSPWIRAIMRYPKIIN
jgi:predicted phosphoadenosine phosphosulfate sulfurtransferase